MTNVFALGDCCNTVERKMAVYAGKQAECVVANIVAEAGGKQVNLRECYQGVYFLDIFPTYENSFLYPEVLSAF